MYGWYATLVADCYVAKLKWVKVDVLDHNCDDAITRHYEELGVRFNHETKDKAALSQAKTVKNGAK